MRRRNPIITVKTEAGCLEVTSHFLDKDGYPTIRRKGKLYRISRYVFELWYGPIPPGLCVRHTCDNPKCISRRHLLIGTIYQNNQDRDLRNRTAKGERNGAAKLTAAQVLQIRQSPKSNQQLANEFKVGKTTIQRVKSLAGWKHVVTPETVNR